MTSTDILMDVMIPETTSFYELIRLRNGIRSDQE